jgi:multiple sugar transport system substrate-binding protein
MIKLHNEQSDVNVELLELPTSADQQRTQQIQRLRAESDECDVLGMDVIWTAEYAAQGWLYALSDAVEQRGDDFIPSTLETAKIDDRYWAVPFNTNAGFVYYRTDQVDQAPKSWEDLYSTAQQDNGVVYQGARYEGLTVNFLELLYADGGTVVSEDGSQAEVSDEATDVLEFMRKGVEDGAVPKAVSTYMEQETRSAFEAGTGTFMRNWPYAYALAKESDIADTFDIAPLPPFSEGGEGASILGGYNLAISAYSKNPEGALEFANFATSPEAQKLMMTKSTLPAVLTETYSDPEVRKTAPFAEDLLKAVQQAQPRPVSPVYPQISEAIYKNVYNALSGDATTDEALKRADDEIKRALETF